MPRDPAADLKDALTVKKTEHLASLSIKEIPEFLDKLEKNEVRLYPQTRRGIKLLMLTADPVLVSSLKMVWQV